MPSALPSAQHDAKAIQSIVRAARILECFTPEHAHPHSLSVIARCCGFNVATTHRTLQTLCTTGLLRRVPDEELYELGPLWRRVASGV